MPHYKYLIVGGGMTADAAVNGIRESDPDGPIGLIGAEQNAPYNRPPLSKGLWKGDAPDSIWRGTDKQNVTLHLGRQAQSLDAPKKTVTDYQGNVYAFDSFSCHWRHASPTFFRRWLDHLLPHSGGLPEPRPHGTRPTVRRYRRRLHRLGNGRSARDERQRGGHALSRRSYWRPRLSDRPGPFPQWLLPPEGRESGFRKRGRRLREKRPRAPK